MAKRGPKTNYRQKTINKDLFEKLCSLHCTKAEICDALGVADKTLIAWCKDTYDGKTFKEAYAEFKVRGNVSLRRNQWKMAENNPTMSIWLGKQYLNQQENKQLMEIKKEELKLKKMEYEIKLKELELREMQIRAQIEEYDDENIEDKTITINVKRGSETVNEKIQKKE